MPSLSPRTLVLTEWVPYLETRPPVQSGKVFIGERGPLTARGVRALCDKCSAIVGSMWSKGKAN
jgi:hypothetical protein